MTGTSEDEFINEAFSEIDEDELESLKNNAEVSKIIAGGKTAYDEIDIQGVKVKFTPFISRSTRRKLLGLDSDTVVGAEEGIYMSLALLSKESPWTSPNTWKFIEANGGDVSEALAMMMARIKERAAQMADFRPNKGGSTNPKSLRDARVSAK